MPRDKDINNKSHIGKLAYNYPSGRTFTDNRSQQERLVKLLQQQEKKRKKQEDRFRAQQEAQQQRAQEEARRAAARQEEIFGRRWDRGPDVFAPNFNRHQEQNNRPFVERDNPADQDNHLNRERFRF